jgi:hypothetical protein
MTQTRFRNSASLAAFLATQSFGFSWGLSVVSTSPDRYELAVSPTLTTISVTFDTAPALPPPGAIRVSGTMSGLKAGQVAVNGNALTFTTSGLFFPGELVNVNLRSDVEAAAGGTLPGGFTFAFTIASQPALLDWSAPVVHGAADVPYFIFGGDLDGDGTPDVAAPNEGTDDVSVFLNNGSGIFEPHVDYGVGETPSSIFGEDFDNDFDLDFATADIASGTVSVGLNHGDGTFAPTTPYESGAVTRQVHGGDFDGDNDIDVCATSKGTNEVYLFYNDGDGTFTAAPPYTDVRQGPFAIRTGDFDLDGHLDIGVACQDVDSLIVLRNDGTGSFTTTGAFRTGDGPWCLNGNDFDGDGDFDLVTVTSYNNRIQVFLNDGTGAFPIRTGTATANFPLGVFVADLDGDGDVDATSSNYAAGSVGVYVNDGSGTLALQATLPVDRSGSYTWAHDLDGDLDLDLSVVDELADSLFVFFNGDAPAVGAPVAAGSPGESASIEAHPNPARAREGIDLRVSGFEGDVTIEVFGVGGRLIRRIHRGTLPEGGRVRWRGRDAEERIVSSGAYVIRARDAKRSAAAVVRLLR